MCLFGCCLVRGMLPDGGRLPGRKAAHSACRAMRQVDVLPAVLLLCDPYLMYRPQGLSHYLEHMLFMGSTKYPDENEYDEFLAAHGGSSNAFTELVSHLQYPGFVRHELMSFRHGLVLEVRQVCTLSVLLCLICTAHCTAHCTLCTAGVHQLPL